MFLTPLNIIVMVLYIVCLAVIGALASRKEENTDDFFLGGRSMPWLAVGLSILATECSAVTFIGAPSIAYQTGGNFTYLQLAIGSLIGRILIATIFLKAFYHFRVTTVYEYLLHRFGVVTQIAGVVFFFLTRLLASGVRLYVASLALHVVFNIPLFTAVMISAGIATAYTIWGGIKAVIWTDVMQIIVFMGGACLVVVLLFQYNGGWGAVMNIALPAEKLTLFDFSLDITREFTLLTGIIAGCFLTFAALGTDQDLTQRMLTCKNVKLAQKALIMTGILDFPVVIVFLGIGVLLFVFYSLNPDPNIPVIPDHIFPYFILTRLPNGISGLLVVGVFAAAMSSLDSALNALASSAVCDIYKPYINRNKEEEHYLLISRISVLVFAILLVGIAYLCKNMGTVLIVSFKITSFTYGALLGVFLIGTLTKRGNETGTIVAMLTSLPVVYFVSKTPVAWPWYIVVGTAWTFLVGILFPPSPASDITIK
ncbi:MAG: hypothetical protein C4541_12460 [Candidatus Auribacter fodinae]|jgi:SSS family transporter|uniref:Sodium:solute symporter n=1 Tax=Candidatus Auribacter fodinae TaxID=2093366 RepID=A0A3A4QR78_9BACT|nr:MAG: hypothetical protein C4541_12460 [Candidatus Auribacter fodinae]